MKKLLFVIVLGALAYGTFKYLESVKTAGDKKDGVLKPSEKALKESEKEDAK